MLVAPFCQRAHSQVLGCFPDITAFWGNSPDWLSALKGEPQQLLKSENFTAYTYQEQILDCPLFKIDPFKAQGEKSYYFNKNGLHSVQYEFFAPQGFKGEELFAHLELALACQFRAQGVRLDAHKNEVKVQQALWENDRTLAYLSSFSTLPVITIKFMDKTAKDNKMEIELFQKLKAHFFHLGEGSIK
ncbi:MAG: hypothetical protein ACRCTY_02775 [Candidatus Adiutrix sp.]